MATIGASAPSSNTTNYDALLSTTLEAWGSRNLVDNIFKDNAFLYFLRNMGRKAVDYQNGGERVRIPLMYGENNTIKTHAGYDVIDVTPQDGLTTAFYEWAEIAGSISISRKEERQNSGESAIIKLLEAKIRQAEMSMTSKLNSDLVLGTVSSSTFLPDTSSSGVYGLLPLGYFFRKLNATDPTSGAVGNISGATYSWWRHRAATMDGTADTGNDFTVNATTWKSLAMGLKRMFNYCSRGSGGSPDVVLADQITFEEYELALDDKIRYQNTKMADVGFESIKLKGATMLWDERVPDMDEGAAMPDAATPAGSAFFINTDFYKLIIDEATDIVTTPFIEPENQTAKTAKILFMGQASVSNMRKHGVAYAISQSLAS